MQHTALGMLIYCWNTNTSVVAWPSLTAGGRYIASIADCIALLVLYVMPGLCAMNEVIKKQGMPGTSGRAPGTGTWASGHES